MHKMRFTILLLLFGLLLGSVSVTAAPYVPRFEEDANLLKDLGLFRGTDKGFELDRPPTRLEALVMLIRLLGQEQDALSETSGIPFTDVPEWGRPYVAYAFKNGLTMGMNDQEFGSALHANEQMFVTFVLRALGYEDESDGSKDFTYEKAVEKAKETGLLSEDYLTVQTTEFMRDGCVAISKQALKTTMKNKTEYLIDELIQKKAVDANKAKKVVSDAERSFQQAEVAYQKRQTNLAEELYLKAIGQDPLQAKYYGSLANMYQWLVKTNLNTKDKDLVNIKLKEAAERAYQLNPNNKDYVRILMIFYLENDFFSEGVPLAEKYVTLQNQTEESCEWLAKGYSDFAINLIKNGQKEIGKVYIEKTISLLDEKQLSNNKSVAFYVGKGYLALREFNLSEKFLEFSSTSSIKDIKYSSDRLLYLIFQETGRDELNKRFHGLMWMGLGNDKFKGVEVSEIYIEMKSIIDSIISA